MYGFRMIWQELSTSVPWEYVEPISYLFSRYGHGLSMENDGDNLVLLRTYLPNTSRRRLARIEVGVNLVRTLYPGGQLAIIQLEEADWETAWKAHFSLLRVGKRLVIKPSWIPYEAEENEVIIELDPGMAFGTGYHPTTKMCLEALEGLMQPGMEVLDLGTGSGILAIAAARLGAASILALDTDPTAVKAARSNFRASGTGTKRLHLVRGSLPHPLAREGRFDLATANISAKIIQDRAPYLHQVLKPGGILIASGVIDKQRQELMDTLTAAGLTHETTYETEDWVALLLSKPTSGVTEGAK